MSLADCAVTWCMLVAALVLGTAGIAFTATVHRVTVRMGAGAVLVSGTF